MRNAYEVLGVTPNTPIDVAAEMYNERRRRIVEAPPGTQPPDETAEQIAALDWAWRVLSDPTARAEHDRALAPFASFGTQPLGPYGGTPTPPPTPPPAGPAPGWGRPAPGQWAPSPWDQSPYPPLAPRKRRTWALVLGLVLVGILIVVPVIFGVLFVMSGQGVQREDGRIVDRGIISVEDLRVGDCFDDPNQIPEGET